MNKHTRKPLELTVFLRDEEHDYRHPLGFWIPEADADHWVEAKRLTDAELAAEHWCYCTGWFAAVRSDDDYDGAPATRELARRATILERFATLPHYDEAGA